MPWSEGHLEGEGRYSRGSLEATRALYSGLLIHFVMLLVVVGCAVALSEVWP